MFLQLNTEYPSFASTVAICTYEVLFQVFERKHLRQNGQNLIFILSTLKTFYYLLAQISNKKHVEQIHFRSLFIHEIRIKVFITSYLCCRKSKEELKTQFLCYVHMGHDKFSLPKSRWRNHQNYCFLDRCELIWVIFRKVDNFQ